MKRLIILFLSASLLSSGVLIAQNNEGKADDSERISLTPQVSDQEIPQGAKDMLLNKMKQICAKNGLSGDGENPFFVMDATIDILSKELTPTAPPMHALNLQVNLYIKDIVNNNVYSETSFEIKGVGKNETKAYIAGLKNINSSKGQFKALVDRGKTKILEFYNSECDFIISKAKALQKQGNNGEAIRVLKSVPKVSLECYDKCMEILAEIEPPVEEIKTESASTNNTSGSAATGSESETEIDDDMYLVFMGGKQMGDKTMLHFELQNRSSADYELNDYALDTRALDANGDEFNVEKVSIAGKSGSRSIATIIPGTPVELECQFAKMDAISMFEYKYKGKTFRLKNVVISGFVGSNEPVAKPKSKETVAVGPQSIGVGDKILAETTGREFRYHTYVPSKIKTIASNATKGEYEIMSMGDGSSENKWTKLVVTKWHNATKPELVEGLVVLYNEYGVSETSALYAGVVVGVDELYKDVVSIKGRYDDIRKVGVKNVVVPDFPKVAAP